MRAIIENPASWGLPSDFNELTAEGQKQARVWRVQKRDTPEDDVLSWNWFRMWHLNHEGAGWFDHYVEPAPMHFEWNYMIAAHPRTLLTAHRGSAKTTVISKERPLRDVVSVPHSKNFIILSSDDAITRHADDLMMQIDGNARIIDDFGKLRAKRTEGVWNHHYMRLTNRASLTYGTVNSMNLRGLRPWVITLDDIERDPKKGTDVANLLAQTNQFFFQVVLPMARRHCKVILCGTPNSKQTLIWRLQNDGDDRIDDKVRFYNKQFWFYDGEGNVAWPAEYPTKEDVDVKRKELGPEVWAMEMLGEETAGEHAVLQIDAVKNEYNIDDPGAYNENDPLNSGGIIKWADSVPSRNLESILVPRVAVASDFYRGLYRFITVDYASTVKKTSDFSVIHVMGMDGLNQIFSLDIWGGKVRQDDLIARIWQMAKKWLVRVVGVEAVALQAEFYGRVAQWRGFMATGNWLPQPVPIRYDHGMSKPERISAIRWRFTDGAVKFPAWLKKTPHYRELYKQIEGFAPDPDRNLTGLGHDDHIDTLAMAQELIGGRRATTIPREPTGDINDMIARGVTEIIPGIPIGTMVPLNQLTAASIATLMARPSADEDRRVHWNQGAL